MDNFVDSLFFCMLVFFTLSDVSYQSRKELLLFSDFATITLSVFLMSARYSSLILSIREMILFFEIWAEINPIF